MTKSYQMKLKQEVSKALFDKAQLDKLTFLFDF